MRDPEPIIYRSGLAGKKAATPATPPPLARRVVTFARAVGDEVSATVSGVPGVSAEEADRRLSICKDGCPNWTGITCRACGCVGNFKARFRSQACPLGKW